MLDDYFFILSTKKKNSSTNRHTDRVTAIAIPTLFKAASLKSITKYTCRKILSVHIEYVFQAVAANLR